MCKGREDRAGEVSLSMYDRLMIDNSSCGDL